MIDDVDYLIANAEKSSQIVYIDSTARNKLFYPTANEYVIAFDQPFKLVYGFDVVDASVPVTMYNVDVYNNTLYYSVLKSNPASLVPIDTEQFFLEISHSKSFIEIFNRDVETHVVIGVETELESLVSAATSTDENYVVFYRTSINTQEIKIKTLQSPSEFYFFSFNFRDYCIKNVAENATLIAILESNEYSLTFNTDSSVDLIYFEKHLIDEATYVSINSSTSFIIIINNYIKSLEIGNYDILTIVNDLNDLLNTSLVEVEPTTAVPKKQAKMMFSSTTLFLLNAAKGELIKSLGFDTYPAATSSGFNYKGYTVGDNYLIFGSVFDTTTSKYQIVSPGLISLLGERFAILRIKELEDHLYGSYSYMKMTPGVGMFKMASAFGGITNLRFDYTTIITKPFHPIGKLSKLSIRFETSSGRLYDFKGVNHQLMVNIKFYVPTQKMKFSRSILNPNYDPNVMEYMAQNRTIQYKEDSDDEEQFDDEEYYQMYKKEMDKNNFSSSEGETDEDDSEEEAGDSIENNRRQFA